MDRLRNDCDYIYGKSVIVECQSQINIKEWKGNNQFSYYITNILNKDINFFIVWSTLKKRVICLVDKPTDEEIEDEIKNKVCMQKNSQINGKRIILWSKDKNCKRFIKPSKREHRKQMAIFRDYTFCVKDKGLHWKGKNI